MVYANGCIYGATHHAGSVRISFIMSTSLWTIWVPIHTEDNQEIFAKPLVLKLLCGH